jgi:glycine/D-amino acid oxidase-like deaminating enzyme
LINRNGQVASALVVGGGIVGLTCALRLQRAAIATQLADPDENRLAPSWNNAGHIAIEQVEPLASWETLRSVRARMFGQGGPLDFRATDKGVARWMLQFVAASSPRRFAAGKQALSSLVAGAADAWRTLVADLGKPGLFTDRGHIVVWETERSAKAKRAAWLRADVGSAVIRDLQDRELDALSHQLKRPLAGGLRFEKTGQLVDPPELFQTLHDRFAAAGGEWVREAVTAVAVENARARAVFISGRPVDAEMIVICAGARSKALMRGAGHVVPLIAERGYHLQVPAEQAQGWWPDLPPVVFEDRSMIVTRFAKALRACSFVELADIESPPDVRKWERLIRHVTELGLPFGDSPSRWMGARPTLPDYLPAIGRSRRAPNLLYAFGHQHLGLTLGPVTAEIVQAIATGAEPQINLEPFDIERFSNE